MCPELCTRRFVTSPVTHTWPTCFSSRRFTCAVSSATVSTLRVASGGKSSPKSHCDCTCPAISRVSGFRRGQILRHSLNVQRLAREVIDFHHHTLQLDVIFRHRKTLRLQRQKTFDDRLNLTANHTLVRPGESRVAQESRAPRKNLFIRRLHVCVRANHRAHLPVEHPRQRRLFRSRLRVQINENNVGLLPQPFHLRPDERERVLQVRHERPPLQIHYRHRCLVV